MDDHSYWRKQTPTKLLFPDTEWSKPQQKSRAGRLAIVGGNKLGFMSVAKAYSDALGTGVGEVRVLLPDPLKGIVPHTVTNAIYAPGNPSGGLAQAALGTMKALGEWANGVLLIGDAGKNSETAIVYENFCHTYNGPLLITRDAVDLLKNSAQNLMERPNTSLVVSFNQLQKLFQAVYYPKMLTFSMQLLGVVEAVHKFTITYPVNLVVFFQDNLVIASDGQVVSQAWDQPMRLWDGSVATKAASYLLWSPQQPLAAIATSIAA